MEKKSYIIASCKEWHRHSFTSLEQDVSVDWVWVSTPEELLGALKKEKPRYIFFLHWNWLVPETIWKEYECVCFHMTDVPYGRGGSPLQNLIVRGHTETKLTALRMVEKMDAGPVYTKCPLSLEGTAHEIYLRAGELSFDLIRWMIKKEPQPKPQKGESVVFKRRTPEQSLLPAFGTVKSVYDHIRMLDAPTYPNAYLEHGEFILEFTEANISEGEIITTVKIRKKSKQRTA